MNNLDFYKFQAMHLTDFSQDEVNKMTTTIKGLVKDTAMSFDAAIKDCATYMLCNEAKDCEEVIGHLKGLINYMEMEGFDTAR